MDKLPEVTWSLMHPTPLNVDYMKRVITEAANYKVDSKRPASSMVMVDRGEIFSKGEMATK